MRKRAVFLIRLALALIALLPFAAASCSPSREISLTSISTGTCLIADSTAYTLSTSFEGTTDNGVLSSQALG